jgi:uncharacterized metal-binding protein YceD (DUF177 family)
LELEEFRIYLDRLKNGSIEKLGGSFSTEFLELKERDLFFSDSLEITGEIYLTDNTLVLHFAIEAVSLQPCLVCNETCSCKIRVKNHYHTEDVSQIKSGIFDFRQVMRDAILLEVPSVVECRNGNCPEREVLAQYFTKDEDSPKDSAGQDAYHPFSDLKVDLELN